jgi:hypothetical protein
MAMKHFFAAIPLALLIGIAARAETLYNGITLPEPWPPTNVKWEDLVARKVMPEPYYIKNPPAVIPIDIGRQLFVDEFLVESSTLKQDLHRPELYPGNPMVRGSPGSIWWYPEEGLFKVWVNNYGLKCSVSKDGVHWDLSRKGEDYKEGRAFHAWIDREATDPGKKFAAIYPVCFDPPGRCQYWIQWSPNGTDWNDKVASDTDTGDASKSYFNPFRRVWVMTGRHGWGKPRARRYWEFRDLEKGPYGGPTKEGRFPLWFCTDTLDPPREDMQIPAQVYDHDAGPYESLMVGCFAIWRGDPPGRSKFKDVCVGFSRDGWSWSRPDRVPHVPISERFGQWNYVNIDSMTSGGYAVMGDKLYFYVTGRGQRFHMALATMRRDGWISMDAGEQGGALTTRPVRFSGKYFFVNVDAPEGELRVEALDEKGGVIAPFTAENCEPVRANKTLQQVTWKGAEDLSALAGKNVRFRFNLKNGKLYSFWVAAEKSGASNGYVCVGGPGFKGARDTEGVAAYAAVTPCPPPGFAPAPAFWPLSGSYDGRVDVSIAVPLYTSVPGTTIRYTMDGTEPTEASPVFDSAKPIVLLGDNEHGARKALPVVSFTLKARAFKDGLKPSAVIAEEFSLTRDDAPPLVYMGTPNEVVPEGTKTVTVRVNTSEKAECRYATSPGVDFGKMKDVMATQDGLLHTLKVDNAGPGDLRRFYIKASDPYGNATAADYDVAFLVPDSGTPKYKVKEINLESGVKTWERVGAFTPWKAEIEGESGKMTAPMGLGEDAQASGGLTAVSYEQDKGTAAYTFNVPASGEYFLWVLAKGAKGDMQDSFFVAVDGGTEDIFDSAGGESAFTWSPVGGRDNRGAGLIPHKAFILGKGEHTLVIRCRKPGAQVDAILVSNDRLGAAPTHKPSNTVAKAPAGTLAVKPAAKPVDPASKPAAMKVEMPETETPNATSVGSKAGTVVIEMEAEAGRLTEPMWAMDQEKASGGKYVTALAGGQGAAAFKFKVAADGDYVVWARVKGPNTSSDSVFVSMDGGPEDVYDFLEAGVGKWSCEAVRGRGSSSGNPGAVSPLVFRLKAGEHTFVWKSREPSAMLDKIAVTNDRDFKIKDPAGK